MSLQTGTWERLGSPSAKMVFKISKRFTSDFGSPCSVHVDPNLGKGEKAGTGMLTDRRIGNLCVGLEEVFGQTGTTAIVAGASGFGRPTPSGMDGFGADLVIADLDPVGVEKVVARIDNEGLVMEGHRGALCCLFSRSGDSTCGLSGYRQGFGFPVMITSDLSPRTLATGVLK